MSGIKDSDGKEYDIERYIPTGEDKEFLERWSTPSIPGSVRLVTPSGYTINREELEYLRGKWLK